MSELDFEYAVRKDVRNNPIVREVDRDRHRTIVRYTLLGFVLLATLVWSATQPLEVVRVGYELERMRGEKAELERLNRHLRLEQATLAAPQRLQDLAVRELGLVVPTPEDLVVIERVTPPEPPSSSLMASR
ncbi:MAG: cell division protein FtsL [Vicinamibacteraceae bacterium]|nr:cell division protein FtsL [Vicinamibacteraceae bacterium]